MSGIRSRGRPAAVAAEPERPGLTPSMSAGAVIGRRPRARRRSWITRYRAILIAMDASGICLALVTGYQFRFSTDLFASAPALNYVLYSGVLAVIWMVALQHTGGYDVRHLATGPTEAKVVLRASAIAAGVLAIYCYATKTQVARGFVVAVVPFGIVLLLAGRGCVRWLISRRRRQGEWVHRILAVGTTESVRQLLQVTQRASRAGLRIVGACVEDSAVGEQIGPAVPVLAGILDAAAAAKRIGADVVAVTGAGLGSGGVRELGWELEGTGCGLVVAPGLTQIAGPRVHVSHVEGLPLMWLDAPQLGRLPRILKRCIDLAGSLLLLAALFPVLVVAACAIKLDTRGPIFYRQRRLGLAGTEFMMMKLRSMHDGADQLRDGLLDRNEQQGGGVLFKMRRDPRLTRVGRVIRRLSIDELPQLVHVLSGQMSLVGPRPLAAIDSGYEGAARRRLLVRPGLTGLWQVSGRSELSWADVVRLDLYYVENWSLGLDMAILGRTILAVLTGSGAYLCHSDPGEPTGVSGPCPHDTGRRFVGVVALPEKARDLVRCIVMPRRRAPLTDVQRRWRRWIKVGVLSSGGLVLLGALWIAVAGLMARTQLLAVRADVYQVRSEITAGDFAAAQRTAGELARHARLAHLETTGPAWALADVVPVGGAPLRTIRGIASSADDLGSQALPALIAARNKLHLDTLREADGSINIAAIRAAAPFLAEADHSLTTAASAVAAQPAHTWLGVVDHARSAVMGPLAGLAHTVHAGDIAAQVAPAMLGADGPKRYFVAFQNDAEARGTGGLPGAFGILVADHGRLTFTGFEKDSAISKTATGLNFGADYAALYGNADPTSLYLNSNLSPNFPYAGQIWAAMWEKHSGQHVDGAIAVDPTAVSYLLRVTGPVTLADNSQVDAGNVVALTQSAVYAKFPEWSQKAAQNTFLLNVARSISDRLLHAHGSMTSLLAAAARAAGERRLLIWSADSPIEGRLERTEAAGSIPVTSASYVGLSIVNDAGNKLDYYLGRSIRWQRTGCGATRTVKVTIALTNSAPADGLSPIVTARFDAHDYPVRPGDNRLEVSYFATDGAVMNSVTADGRPTTAGSGTELGHPVFTVDLELPRGTTRTVVFHLTEPAGSGTPVVLRQPLVRTLQVSLEDAGCG